MIKNILLFIDSLGAGGAQRQLTGLAVLLKGKGYGVKVVTYHDHPFYQHILEENHVEYECMRTPPRKCLLMLVSIVKRFETDVLISFQTGPNSLACVAAWLTRKPLIVSERNTHTSISRNESLIFQLYRNARYVVPNSYSEAKFIGSNFKFLEHKVTTISNFVDLDKFTPKSNAIILKPRKMLIVASVKDSKNTKRFIDAFEMAKRKGCELQVEWYGINPKESELPANYIYTQECVKMVEDKGIGDSLKLLLKRKDIQNAYREADIFCLPSLFEGTPNVICEAMASGLPVIASDVCDNSRYVHEGENGFLFNPLDIESMSEAMLKVSNMTDEELATFGKNSRTIAERQCSMEEFVNKYIKLIETL